jgi:hypothetical protein
MNKLVKIPLWVAILITPAFFLGFFVELKYEVTNNIIKVLEQVVEHERKQ